MLPVFICEDDEGIRSICEEYIRKQIIIEGYDMEVALSSGCPEEVLGAAAQLARRGIYFLDVELKGETMDGFSLGYEIRKIDSRGFIVYVTAFKDLAFETFRYHLEALDYIVKENPEKMLRGISHSLAVINDRMLAEAKDQREFFTVKEMDIVKHVPMDEILFFETSGRTHRIELHGFQDRFDFIGSMRELEKQLGGRFLRVHRAYLVNVEQIREVDLKHRELLMKNGERCLISRNVKGELLNKI